VRALNSLRYRDGHEVFSVVTGVKAAVCFTTDQWGKPQLSRSKGAGGNAEGASLPAIASRSGEAGGNSPLISRRKNQAESLGTEEKTSCPPQVLPGYVKCKQ
jgi:hypothetical protein